MAKQKGTACIFGSKFNIQYDKEGVCVWDSNTGDRLIDFSLFAKDGVIELNMERFKSIGLDGDGFMRFKLKNVKKKHEVK